MSRVHIHKKRTASEWLSDNGTFIAAFLIPVFVMILIYYIRGVYPFGTEMYLRSDMYHQYAPFHREFARKLREGGSLFYSWNVGMGVNFLSYIAYYLASPFNLLLVFCDNAHVIEMMSVFIIVKTGVASFTFTYYLSKKFESKKMIYAIFGIAYALSSYYAAFNWNLMWLDCMWLLPVIVLGIEKLVEEDKPLVYCISLGFAVFSNYYIAIMLCIFSVLYFVYQMIVTKQTLSVKKVISKCIRFGIFSLIAGGLAAVLVIPEYCTLMATQSGNFNFDWKGERYFSVLYMLARSLYGVPAAVFDAHDPNLYCSVGAFLVLPLYWMCKNVRLREKVGKTVLLGILLISFSFNIPNYIWHGLHFPNSLPARESFIYIFLLLMMGAEAVKHAKEFSNKQILGCFGGALALILVIEQVFIDNDKFGYKVIYTSLLFLAVYALLILAYKYTKHMQKFIVYLVFIAVVTELTMNMNATGISTTSRTYYVSDNSAIDSLVKKANASAGTKFFRMEKSDRRTKNDQAWHGYHGMSTFSSTSLKGVADYYTMLGFEESYNSYAYYGATPVTSSMFSVKYTLDKSASNDLKISKNVASAKCDDGSEIYLNENLYTLPLGFMVNSGMEQTWDTNGNDPFEIQNGFLRSACGSEDVFSRMTVKETSDGVEVDATEDSDMYVDMLTKNKSALNVMITDKNGETVSTKTFSNMDKPYIVHVGEVKKGQKVTLTASGDENSSNTDSLGLQLYAYNFHADKFINAYNELSQSGLDVTNFSDTKIEGTVNAAADGTLYTSISYEKGWTATVDGKEVKTAALKNGMLTIPLKAGNHKVTFKFVPQGFQAGLVISLVSLALLILYIIFVIRKKKKVKENTPDAVLYAEKKKMARAARIAAKREEESVDEADPRENPEPGEKVIIVSPTYKEDTESVQMMDVEPEELPDVQIDHVADEVLDDLLDEKTEKEHLNEGGEVSESTTVNKDLEQ